MKILPSLKILSIVFILTSVLSTKNAYPSGNNIEEFLPLTNDQLTKKVESNVMPKNFRSTNNEITAPEGEELPRLDGMQDLHIMGTAQFTEPQLVEILKWQTKRTLVVDLRRETHLFLEEDMGNQIPITAYAHHNTGNLGKSEDEIELDLHRYKEYILEKKIVTLYETKDSEVQFDKETNDHIVSNVYTEREVVERLNQTFIPGIEYELLPLEDHMAPAPEYVDVILELLDRMSLDPQLDVIFHCRAGRGRTGLMMVMTDIVRNARKYDLSLEEILKRQFLLGSPDFSKVKPGRAEQSSERYEFVKHFYQYVLAEDGFDSGVSYSFWNEVHPMGSSYIETPTAPEPSELSFGSLASFSVLFIFTLNLLLQSVV